MFNPQCLLCGSLLRRTNYIYFSCEECDLNYELETPSVVVLVFRHDAKNQIWYTYYFKDKIIIRKSFNQKSRLAHLEYRCDEMKKEIFYEDFWHRIEKAFVLS